MGFQERLERTKTNQDANCWGTAYFLSGASDLDFQKDPGPAIGYWNRLATLDRPRPLCYAGIVGPMPKGLHFPNIESPNEEYLYHLGIVTSTHPIKITHRNGDKGPIFENELLTTMVERDIIDQRLRVEFRAFMDS